jgi:type IV pilus assembly protein PilE
MTPHARPARRRPCRGFTLVETMVAVAIAGVLSSIAYPSLEGHVLRARRTDAMVALMQVQLAEERFRTGSSGYGSLAEIGMRSSSPSSYYNLEVRGTAGEAYEIVAAASGVQAHDTACRTLRLAQGSNGLVFASGPDAAASNPPDVNRKCWNQ